MIKLKIKAGPMRDDFYGVQLAPYIDKVIENLHKTQLKPELAIPLETAIRHKTKIDAEKLFRLDNFDVCKDIYMTNARHMIANLKNNNEINNLELIEKVNNGDINPEDLVNLKPEEMHNDRWKLLLEKKKADIEKMTKDPEATTDLFLCNRCHRNKCTYFERQDRSADECMTIHITCCYCGKKWRQ
jgi:DNA-directed RNA polymerase subunit M/transcription elongation factor TFIIS